MSLIEASIATTEYIKIEKDRFYKSVKAQYQNWRWAYIREIIQNSVDAGATRLDITHQDDWILASDNGCGMTLVDFRKYYLNLGGTHKPNRESRGAFGSAKELISFAWTRWFVRSLDFVCDGKQGEEIQSLEIPGINGFETYSKHEDFRHQPWESIVKNIMLLSDIPMDVYFNDRKVKQGRKLNGTSFAEINDKNLYCITTRKNAAEMEGYLAVRAGGLFMFHQYFGGQAASFKWYYDVDYDSVKYLTQSRDSLKYDIQAEITKLMADAIKAPKGNKPKIELYIGTKPVEYKDIEYEELDELPAPKPVNGKSDKIVLAEPKVEKVINNNKEWLLYRKYSNEPFSFAFLYGYKTKVNFLNNDNTLKEGYHQRLSLIMVCVKMMIEEMNKGDWYIDSSTFIPGILYDKKTEASFCKTQGYNIISLTPAVFKEHPNYIIAVLIHELTHYWVDVEGMVFENQRMLIEKAVAGIREHLITFIESLL
jgi:hypothetical protein